MFTAFSTALSALAANTTAVDVVSNNLANMNTTGYKTSSVAFRDLVTESVGAGLGETQVGFGTATPLTQRQFTQGAVQGTGGLLDAAIQGDGFFILQNNLGAQLFTRAGNFQTDGEGYLLTSGGEYVLGWTEDANGVVDMNQPIGKIVVPVGDLKAPIATTACSVDLNLNAAAVNGAPEGTYSTPLLAIDSLGVSHTLTVTFTKSTNANEWDYSVTIPGADVGAAGPQELVTGTLTFDSYGHLTDPPLAAGTVPLAITGLASGAADMNIDWQLYNPAGAARITQYNQISSPTANAQNGSAPAALTKVGIADGGQILASYSNGTQRVVGLLAVASIRNPQSLIAVGNNNFLASEATALPAIGSSNTGGRGKVVGASLEYSTVDIAKEFTNLIVYQRAYQVNSRVVTTADEMSQETVNLKR
ncbi:MAG: flagellar hook protein FlgE [Acidobacteriota bacterium]